MSLNFSYNPGKIFATGEKVTTAKINQATAGTITAEGSIGPTDMGAGDYSAALGPGAYVYELAVLTALNYAATYDPAVVTYGDGLWLTFKTDAANPAAATFDAGAGAKPLYASGGTRAPDAGEIPSNTIVQVRYNTSLNGGLGGWQIMSTLRDRRVIFDLVGASAQLGGLGGLVPAPLAGDQAKFLRGDGTWYDASADISAAIVATGALNPLPLYLSVNY